MCDGRPITDHELDQSADVAGDALLRLIDLVAKAMRLEIGAGYLKWIPLRKPFVRDIALRTRRNAYLTPITQRFEKIVRAVAKETRAGE